MPSYLVELRSANGTVAGGQTWPALKVDTPALSRLRRLSKSLRVEVRETAIKGDGEPYGLGAWWSR